MRLRTYPEINNELDLTDYGNGIFAPDAKLSHAMLAQILYNNAGSPSVTSNRSFTDAGYKFETAENFV